MDVRFETKYGRKAGKYEWLTPPELIKSLGEFDMDPCYSEPRPWPTAKKHYGIADNGLNKDLEGFVWCNPPYGSSTELWLKKLSDYKHGLALIFARTETKMFKKYVWDTAKAVLFFYGRLSFYNSDGTKGKMSAGAPSCCIAWDSEGVERLKRISNLGKLVYINS